MTLKAHFDCKANDKREEPKYTLSPQVRSMRLPVFRQLGKIQSPGETIVRLVWRTRSTLAGSSLKAL